jgi:hypothetical protein
MKRLMILLGVRALAVPSAALAGPPVREHPGADKDQSATHGDCKNPGPKGDWANEPGQPKTTGWHNGYDCGPATPPVVTPPPPKPCSWKCSPPPVQPPKACPPPPPVCSCPAPPTSTNTSSTTVTNTTTVIVVKVVHVKVKPRHHAKRHVRHHRRHHAKRHARPHYRAPRFAG